jgi:hypothetical protein
VIIESFSFIAPVNLSNPFLFSILPVEGLYEPQSAGLSGPIGSTK